MEQKVLSNIPALAGMYLLQQQTTDRQEYPKEADLKNDDGLDEMDIEENKLADVGLLMWICFRLFSSEYHDIINHTMSVHSEE